MKTKITVNGMFTNKILKDISTVMGAMDFGLNAIVFPMSFEFVIAREEGKEYVAKLRAYLLENPDWSDELSIVSIKSIDITYIEL